ncbi:MAG: nucleoside phosphorylase [Gammaproteobacteria bacterium]|jgi:uridine phosphorylase
MKTEQIQNADVVSDVTGRQYHIALAPGELAEYIILVGEAKRAERAAALLDNITVEQHNREYRTFTGEYKGTPISVMSTGMGPGCIEIGMIEVFHVTKNPTFIRVGTCGSLQEQINLGDMVISSGAVRLEDTSTYFVHEGYPAIAHHEVIMALMMASEQQEIPYHVGLTATASGFYGAQGRKIPGIHVKNPDLPDQMAAMNVYNFEMESSTIFNLANMKGFRASTICEAVANRPKGTFIDPELKAKRETEALIIGFEAFRLIEQMDKVKAAKNKTHWLPKEI